MNEKENIYLPPIQNSHKETSKQEKENYIKVFLRVRPFLSFEFNKKHKSSCKQNILRLRMRPQFWFKIKLLIYILLLKNVLMRMFLKKRCFLRPNLIWLLMMLLKGLTRLYWSMGKQALVRPTRRDNQDSGRLQQVKQRSRFKWINGEMCQSFISKDHEINFPKHKFLCKLQLLRNLQ